MALPSGYKELNYIQSSGTQYIDTGFVPTASTRIVMDFQLTESRKRGYLLGVTGDFSFQWHEQYESESWVFRWSGSMVTDFPAGISATSRHTVEKYGTTCTIDGSTSKTVTNGSSVKLSLYLLACHFDSYANYFAYARLFSCKIYQSGTLVRDYIPCQDAAGAAGLWDDVNSKFYGNAGTGTFIAGGIITPATAHKAHVNGSAVNTIGGSALVAGTAVHITKGRILASGTGYDISFKKYKQLSEYAEGEKVFIPENGITEEFLVTKHDYESGLNGAGRTLLMRLLPMDNHIWHNSNTPIIGFPSSDLCSWLNSTYKGYFPDSVQALMGTTKFYYTNKKYNDYATAAKSIFIPSYIETGRSTVCISKDGSLIQEMFNIFNPVGVSSFLYTVLNGLWLRTTSPSDTDNTNRAVYLQGGIDSGNGNLTESRSIMPIFTLPETASFNAETNEIKL